MAKDVELEQQIYTIKPQKVAEKGGLGVGDKLRSFHKNFGFYQLFQDLPDHFYFVFLLFFIFSVYVVLSTEIDNFNLANKVFDRLNLFWVKSWQIGATGIN